jgi:signal peptidase I
MQKLGKVLAWTAGILVAIVVVLRLLLLTIWKVPDDAALAASIAPTMSRGDTVLILTRGTPGFGDLVRCPDPDDASKFVVGRIVGVESDVVEIQGRQVSVNGKSYNPSQGCPPRKYTTRHPNTGAEVELECGVVEMGGGLHYRGKVKGGVAPVSTRTEIGKGMVFLLSDDIDFHDDSRDFGTVERSKCGERIFFRLWSERGWSDVDARLSLIR